jgi:hypothetical protein
MRTPGEERTAVFKISICRGLNGLVQRGGPDEASSILDDSLLSSSILWYPNVP